MKLKIYFIALLTLLNFTVNAAGNDDDNNSKSRKRKKFETTEDENIAKRFCPAQEDDIASDNEINNNKTIDDCEHDKKKNNNIIDGNEYDNENNNNNIIDDNEYDNENNNNIIDDNEYNQENKDPTDDGTFFHDHYQNFYNLLTDLEKWKKGMLLVSKIDTINTAFKSDTINNPDVIPDEMKRRRDIILAVSESFNIKLLSHFGHGFQNNNHLEDINTNDVINFKDDMINPNNNLYSNLYAFLKPQNSNRPPRMIYEQFSLHNLNQRYLHPETFNELLTYFPWIKIITCNFGIQKSDYALKIFNKIDALFSNIRHLKKIEKIILSNTNNTRMSVCKKDLPKWAHKINFVTN
ncbi:MAG: hypothetical protein Q8L85_08720 [Alphaproteobacteria bacterium]|nr:hypothetical protein [Alphaproteobacteria bacterium]